MRTLHLHHKLPWRKFIVDGIAATFFWIIVLTPFMLLSQPSWLPLPIFIGMNFDQYKTWLVIEFILVPFLGAMSVIFIRRFELFAHLRGTRK